jgi:hypothetical protein
MALCLKAQSTEIGLLFGASNYHGDLAQSIVMSESHFSAGVYYRHNFNQYWTYRPTLSYMHISGSDENFEEYRLRNLSFYSDIIEFSNVIEFNYQPFSQEVFHQNQSFYNFLGISVFYFNPKTVMNGREFKLREHNTENLPVKNIYNLVQIAVPFGVGYKFAPTKNLILGLELGWRMTFTDYLDDVSTVYPDLDEFEAQAGLNSRMLSDRSFEVSETGMHVNEYGDQRGDPKIQ